MRVVEIFQSIEGEGKRIGLPCVFIRLAGCNLRCSYCDTSYAQQNDQGEEMCIEDIVHKVGEFGIKAVTVTGGEPLTDSDISKLLWELSTAGYQVNVETNGSIPLELYLAIPNVFFTVDFKLISSGHHADMKVNYNALTADDVVKFVAGTEEDLYAVDAFLNDYSGCVALKFLSPVFGEMNPQRLVEWVLADESSHDIRVQVQLHKVIWSPETRGV